MLTGCYDLTPLHIFLSALSSLTPLTPPWTLPFSNPSKTVQPWSLCTSSYLCLESSSPGHFQCPFLHFLQVWPKHHCHGENLLYLSLKNSNWLLFLFLLVAVNSLHCIFLHCIIETWQYTSILYLMCICLFLIHPSPHPLHARNLCSQGFCIPTALSAAPHTAHTE